MSGTAPVETAVVSPDVKRESNPLDAFDFSMSSPEASKRPLENGPTPNDNPEAKRLKTEEAPPIDDEMPFEFDVGLLVQNALENFNEQLGGQTNQDLEVVPSTEPGTAGEIMDLDPTPGSSSPVAPVPFLTDPEKFIRTTNLHALGSLATSILLVLSQRPFDEMTQRIREPDSEHARSLRKLQHTFEKTREIYTTTPVLNPAELDMHDPDARTILHLANLAQLACWLIEGGPDQMRHADAHLFTMLYDEATGLPKRAADLWTAIKTLLALDAVEAKTLERSDDDILSSFFIQGIEKKLAEYRADQQLTDSDRDVLTTLQNRHKDLQDVTKVEGGIATARVLYSFDDGLRSFGAIAREQLSSVSHIGDKLGIPLTTIEASPTPVHDNDHQVDLTVDEMDGLELDSFFEKQTASLVEGALAGFLEEQNGSTSAQNGEQTPAADIADAAPKAPEQPAPQTNGTFNMTDYKELEALVAESTSNYVKTTLQGLSPAPYQPTVPTSTTESMAAQSNYLSHLQNQHGHSHYYTSFSQPVPEQPSQPQQPATGEHLPPNQSFPSAILYDKARQAALSKTTAHTRREGTHSTRRPWSQEEEKALMAGLDMVKGPHWSQILTLFGQNGTISDILKDRTQVQLKDKARNLKLFFLKTNSEMPFYLQAVTGELKTRAPTQAARKEAEERARLNSEEDQAKLQGIMALAGGLQHPPQNRTSGSPATGAQNTHMTASPRPAQILQAIAQPPPRPQSQLPPQLPRPQPQTQASPAPQVTQGYGQQPTHHPVPHLAQQRQQLQQQAQYQPAQNRPAQTRPAQQQHAQAQKPPVQQQVQQQQSHQQQTQKQPLQQQAQQQNVQQSQFQQQQAHQQQAQKQPVQQAQKQPMQHQSTQQQQSAQKQPAQHQAQHQSSQQQQTQMQPAQRQQTQQQPAQHAQKQPVQHQPTQQQQVPQQQVQYQQSTQAHKAPAQQQSAQQNVQQYAQPHAQQHNHQPTQAQTSSAQTTPRHSVTPGPAPSASVTPNAHPSPLPPRPQQQPVQQHSLHTSHSQSPAAQVIHSMSATPTPTTTPAPAHSPAPAPVQASAPVHTGYSEPVTNAETHDDNAEEAALLQGLQAAISQAIA